MLVETGAGQGSSLSDAEFAAAGASLVDASTAWSAEVVCKVKEPQEAELSYLRPGLVLFTYLHLAAYPGVAKALLESETTGVAYETVQLPTGDLPLLAPMSEVAGRIATQVGAHFLEASHGTRGILLGGVPGVRPARRGRHRSRQRWLECRLDRSRHGGRSPALGPRHLPAALG